MSSSPAEKKVRARPSHHSPSSTGAVPLSLPVAEERADELTRSAGTVSVAVMASRVLGLVREMVLAYFFRTGGGLDAFYAAFRIPNLLRDMFAEGALSKAFVSTFTEVGEKQGDQAGVRLANLVLNAVLVIVGSSTLLGIYFSEEIVSLMLPGDGFDLALPADEAFGFANKRELTIFLTQVMFPFLLLVSLSAVAMGYLNARGAVFYSGALLDVLQSGLDWAWGWWATSLPRAWDTIPRWEWRWAFWRVACCSSYGRCRRCGREGIPLSFHSEFSRRRFHQGDPPVRTRRAGSSDRPGQRLHQLDLCVSGFGLDVVDQSVFSSAASSHRARRRRGLDSLSACTEPCRGPR